MLSWMNVSQNNKAAFLSPGSNELETLTTFAATIATEHKLIPIVVYV